MEKSNELYGLEGLAHACVAHALYRITLRSYSMKDAISAARYAENWEDALWLLTDARDEFLPILSLENSEFYYQKIKQIVLKSEGYAVLKQIVKVMPKEEADKIISDLAKHDITLGE